MKRFLCTLVLLALFLSACARDKLSIGAGDPKNEFEQCVTLMAKHDFEKAIQCLEMYKARYPKSVEAQEAELKVADVQFAKKDYLLAAESYRAFLRLWPTHPKADYAHYRAGVSYFRESPKSIDRDQEYLTDAIKELRTTLTRFPGSPYTELTRATLHVALNRIAKRHFYVGRFYYRTGEYLSAVPRFMEVADTFPDSGIADKALFYLVKANIGLNRIEAAKEGYSRLALQYPKSPYTKKAESDLLSAAKH